MTAATPIPTAPPASSTPAIYAALHGVMRDVGVVPKLGRNTHDNYDFRKAEDVMNALHPALVQNGVLMIPATESCELTEYTTKKGAAMSRAVVRVVHRFIAAEDGSSLEVVTYGEGSDVGDKAVNKAHTAALKTAICAGLMIPTEALWDSESESPEERDPAPAPGPSPATPLSGPATEADLDRIMAAIGKRCGELEVDPETYSEIIVADVLHGTPWTWETVPDIPRNEIGWICSSISIWEERDNAPGFADGEAPPPPQEAA